MEQLWLGNLRCAVAHMRCEDYPCCGHGPPPLGDDGGCPDANGCFDCVTCGGKLPKGNHSSICDRCQNNPRMMHPDEPDMWGDPGPDLDYEDHFDHDGYED